MLYDPCESTGLLLVYINTNVSIEDVVYLVLMNIFRISNFYNFLLYIVKDINGQSCVLTYVHATCILKPMGYILLICIFKTNFLVGNSLNNVLKIQVRAKLVNFY